MAYKFHFHFLQFTKKAKKAIFWSKIHFFRKIARFARKLQSIRTLLLTHSKLVGTPCSKLTFSSRPKNWHVSSVISSSFTQPRMVWNPSVMSWQAFPSGHSWDSPSSASFLHCSRGLVSKSPQNWHFKAHPKKYKISPETFLCTKKSYLELGK